MVVLIIGIISKAVSPIFINTNETIFAQASANHLSALLENASSSARSSGRNALIEFEKERIMLWSARGMTESITLPDVTLETNLPNNMLIYNPKGKPQLEPLEQGEITIKDDGFEFKIYIFPSGKIKVGDHL